MLVVPRSRRKAKNSPHPAPESEKEKEAVHDKQKFPRAPNTTICKAGHY